MLIGLPGSGKSTWASHFVQAGHPFVVISTDQIRADLYGDESIQGNWQGIWQEVTRRLEWALGATQAGAIAGVVYDATNTQRGARRQVLQQARSLGYTRCIGVWVDVPVSLCLARNAQRSRQVPEAVIETMARRLAAAPPHWDEGFDALVRLGANTAARAEP